MGFLAGACLFFGYLLVYAATANHGRYAGQPWQGVMADAYVQPSSNGGGDAA